VIKIGDDKEMVIQVSEKADEKSKDPSSKDEEKAKK